MTYIMQILGNRPIWAGIYAWFVAQAIKVILTFISERRFAFERMWGSGGMPSSHSALVCALTACIGKHFGFDAPIFAVSVILSFIVMYDATGVRREAGNQAKAINFLFMHSNLKFEQQLKELLGHTPSQVFAGAFLGIVIGLMC
jgi:acid phosphatase family membrane protein YuiD